MKHGFEYMIIYRTPQGKRAGLYKGMCKEELDKVICRLQNDGCFVEKVEIIRHCT